MIPSRGGTCWSKCDGCDACVAIKELEDLVWTLASMDANEAAKMAMPEYLTMMKAIQVARRAVSFAQQEGIQRRVWWGQSLSSAVDDVAAGTEVLPEKWRTTPAKVKGLLDVIGKDPSLPELLTELLDRTTLETVKACEAAHASGISWREIDPDNPPEQRASEVVQPEWENPFPKPTERHWQIARQWINGTGAGTSRLMKERTLAALLAYERAQMPERSDSQRTSEEPVLTREEVSALRAMGPDAPYPGGSGLYGDFATKLLDSHEALREQRAREALQNEGLVFSQDLPGAKPAPRVSIRHRLREVAKGKLDADTEAEALCNEVTALVEWARDAGPVQVPRANAAVPDEKSDQAKRYVKARVYGAIAAEYQRALTKIRDGIGVTASHVTAREALDWRHSENGGVPREAVDEIGALLGGAQRTNEARPDIEIVIADKRISPTWLDHIQKHLYVKKDTDRVGAFWVVVGPLRNQKVDAEIDMEILKRARLDKAPNDERGTDK